MGPHRRRRAPTLDRPPPAWVPSPTAPVVSSRFADLRETAGSVGPTARTRSATLSSPQPSSPQPAAAVDQVPEPLDPEAGGFLVGALVDRLPEFVPVYLAMVEACDDDPGGAGWSSPSWPTSWPNGWPSSKPIGTCSSGPSASSRPTSQPADATGSGAGRRTGRTGLLRLLLARGSPAPGPLAGPARPWPPSRSLDCARRRVGRRLSAARPACVGLHRVDARRRAAGPSPRR